MLFFCGPTTKDSPGQNVSSFAGEPPVFAGLRREWKLEPCPRLWMRWIMAPVTKEEA
jgi:hypothetical protein